MKIKYNGFITFLLLLMLVGISAGATTAQEDETDVERLGNPFAERYADEDEFYARNIWTMTVFDGRIYFGGGNSSNFPPAANAGPVDVWSYDPEAEQFNQEYTVEEEQIDRYAVDDGMLYIPGHDERDGSETGNIYRLEDDGWKKYRTVPNTIHVYDLHAYQGRLFATIDNTQEDNAVVVVSDDDGMTWTPIPATLNLDPLDPALVSRGWSLFEIGDDLYLNAFSTMAAVVRPNGQIEIIRELQTVFRFDGEVFQAVEPHFFPGAPVGYMRRVPRAAEFDGQTIYIGAETVNDHQWQPFGIYAADPDLDVQRLLEDSDLTFWDVLADDDTLFVLASEKIDDDSQRVVVLATRDLDSWERVIQFTSDTYARSFVRLDGDFYFGLGCDTEAPSSACGDVLRVDSSNVPS